MLKLKNVSKFYYNKGTVASGFTKINLDLNIGEFVVITGESGSGKSTLLNVISGLDTYEEGEMYINGEETSYYGESDFEEYRKKYIGNIFQNFNLISSYTVYQNIELVYLLNHTKDDTTKNKIEELLNKVDLIKYKNTVASKLSGGQKQRVAIARALAKETPIIVADEPTGNLDSVSAKSIMKILHDISKDKLVIIVTHNYDQVEEYATRKIKMHDGKILEDRKISNTTESKYEVKDYGNITFMDKLKLSIRNTFNVIPKFLLLLLVYLFLTIAVIGEYTSNKKTSYSDSFLGYNQFFSDYRDERIVIKKKDKSPITDNDYELLSKLDNVNYIVKDDSLLDTTFALTDDNVYLNGKLNELKDIDSVDVGRMPEEDNEVIVLGTKDEYYLSNSNEILDKELYIVSDMNNVEMTSYKVKVVGIKYEANNFFSFYNVKFYSSKKVIDDVRKSINRNYSDITITLNDSNMDTTIIPSKVVEKGNVVIDDNLSYLCKNVYCKGNKININVKNLYYEDKIEVNISNTVNKNNLERLTGYKDEKYLGYVIMNEEDYYSLFDKENYQSSIFVSDVKKVGDTTKLLEDNGYTTLHVKDTLVDFTESIMVFVKLLQVFGVVLILIALFFISYFIIKIILKSRNTYFSVVRILGASKKDVKILLNMELNTVLNLSYLLVLIFFILVNSNVINIPYIKDLIGYLKFTDYIILYIILFLISVIISNKYSKNLFKTSAMKTYREGSL